MRPFALCLVVLGLASLGWGKLIEDDNSDYGIGPYPSLQLGMTTPIAGVLEIGFQSISNGPPFKGVFAYTITTPNALSLTLTATTGSFGSTGIGVCASGTTQTISGPIAGESNTLPCVTNGGPVYMLAGCMGNQKLCTSDNLSAVLTGSTVTFNIGSGFNGLVLYASESCDPKATMGCGLTLPTVSAGSSSTPEPSSLALLGLGLVAFAGMRLRARQSARNLSRLGFDQ